MMPFWLWLLSGFFLPPDSEVQVPFVDMTVSLILLTAPLGIGLLIRRFKQTWADFLVAKVLKPFSFVLLVAMFSVTFWTTTFRGYSRANRCKFSWPSTLCGTCFHCWICTCSWPACPSPWLVLSLVLEWHGSPAGQSRRSSPSRWRRPCRTPMWRLSFFKCLCLVLTRTWPP